LRNVSFVPTWVRYINAKGAYDVHPTPIGRILNTPLEQSDYRAKDIIRAKSAYNHIAEVLLGFGGLAGEARREIFIK